MIYLALGGSYWKCWNAILTFNFRLTTTYTWSSIYLWHEAFSYKKTSVRCHHLLNHLLGPNGRGTGSRGMSVARRTKLCPHPWGKRNHITQVQWKISTESVSFSSSTQSQSRRGSQIGEPHGEVQGWFLWNRSWKGFVTMLVPHP